MKKNFSCLQKISGNQTSKKYSGDWDIDAVKIVARVVTPYRFSDNGHYLSYTGLIKHEKISGDRSYGKKYPRYCQN